MDKEQLLEWLNNQLTRYDDLILTKEQLKDNLDAAIAQMQQSILDFENQKTDADNDIVLYNVNKLLVDQIIVIVEASN
jgi:hypothetical protein